MKMFNKDKDKKEDKKSDKESKKDSKSLPAVPSKSKTPVLPSKDKKPPPKVPTAKDKKPAPTIPAKADKSDKEEKKERRERPVSTHGKTGKKKSATLTESETLKAQVQGLEQEVQRLRKLNTDLEKKLSTVSSVADAAQSEQAKNLLSILARVNSANEWMGKVKALESLLGALAELKQFQATAPGRVAHVAHVKQMQEFDQQCAKLNKNSSDIAKLEAECVSAAAAVKEEFAKVAGLQETDKTRLTELIDSVDEALKPVAPDVKAPKTIPPHAISKVVTDFNAYKKDFELTVIPAHDKIAGIIAELEGCLAQSARMNSVVEDADSQFNELFTNAKFFVENERSRKADPEFARLQAHYVAQLAALEASTEQRAAAKDSVARRGALEGEIKDAKKALRSKQRELEDLRDDGDIKEGSDEEKKRLEDIASARAALVQLVDEDTRLAAQIAGTATAPTATALTQRKLDGSYTYSALDEGVLKAKLAGDDTDCVLKVTQKPAEKELAAQLEALGTLGNHPNLVPVKAAFVDGPHLYMHMPFYEKDNLDKWLESKPSSEASARVAFGVLNAIAHLHARGATHGSIRPSAVLIDDDQDDIGATGVRAVLNSFWGAAFDHSANDYVAPEVASGKDATSAADMFSFGLVLLRCAGLSMPTRKSLSDKVSLPKIKDKSLASLLPELVDVDPSKRISALKALAHPYFADQYTTLSALKDSNNNLRATRNALSAISSKKSSMSASEIDAALAKLSDRALFDAPHRLILPAALPAEEAKKEDDGDDEEDKKDEKESKKEKKSKKDKSSNTAADAALAAYEQVGKALMQSMLERKPLSAPLAPVLLKYLLGVLPSSVRDLLRDLDQFDPERARHFRQVRLIDDVNELSIKMADDTPVTNTNREAYLKEAIAAELIDVRKPSLDALRKGFFSISGVKDELRKLKATELAVLLAGEDYLSGEQVLSRAKSYPNDAKTAAFEKCVRHLAVDDLRRVLFASTAVAALDSESNLSVVYSDDDKTQVSFEPNFARINVQGNDDVANALGSALSVLDKPLK